MIITYLIISILISVGLFFNRSKSLNYTLICLFLLVQTAFTVYACWNYNETTASYFTFDSLGLIMLITATIISIPSVFHSYVYIEESEEVTPRSRATYFGALALLITAVSTSYLANHIAVIWIFAEINTLTARALIYHHRKELALAGAWKYIFICCLLYTFVFIGILFLSPVSYTH